MSDEGPIFPKKTDPEGKQESPPVVIERSDDPNFGQTTSSGSPNLPNVQGKTVGCSSSVFLVMLVGIGMLAFVVARVIA
jgi:hypothetical protein